MTVTRTHDRWIVEGVIESASPLAMRTGASRLEDRPRATEGELEKREDEHWLHEIDVDNEGRPVIAATGLKGVLLSLLTGRRSPENDDRIKLLFGSAAHGSDEASAGRAEFRNATWLGFGKATVGKRGMVRMDRGTGAAEHRRLRNQQFAEVGTSFSVKIVLDGVEEADVAFLVAALRLIDGSAVAALGGSTRQGYGRVRWCQAKETVRHLGVAEILSWLGDRNRHWRDSPPLAKDRKKRFEQAIDAVTKSWNTKLGPIALKDMTLVFDSFFLVSQAVDTADTKTPGSPDRWPLGTTGHRGTPRLPGTGMKGPLRSQAERILRTLTNMSEDMSIVDTLFGSEKAAGLLRFSDFVGRPDTPIRHHEMVAIDRFTGGAAGEQKFSHAVFEAPTLKGEIVIDKVFAVMSDHERRMLDAALGLFVLVLRDLAEGDIGFGFGTRKGYGRIASVRVGDAGLLPAICKLAEGEDRVLGWVKTFRAEARAQKSDRLREEA